MYQQTAHHAQKMSYMLLYMLCPCACYPESALFSHLYQSLTSLSRPDSNHISYLRMIPLHPLNSSLKGIPEIALDASVLLSWKVALQRAKCASSFSLNPLRCSTEVPSTSAAWRGKMSSNLCMNYQVSLGLSTSSCVISEKIT